ncbi:MAG: hypothetical protein ABFS32_23595 [Bacteroidota bacterium]
MKLLSSVNALAQDEYITWTFDDFNENCEVVDTTEYQNSLEINIEYGELGW